MLEALAQELMSEAMLVSDRRARVFEKIVRRVSIEHRGYIDNSGAASACWVYTGRDSGKGRGGGYPRIEIDGGTVAVHIAMWVNENGIIPPRKQLDHLCRTRMCIRPSHQELVTHLTNQKRRSAAAREKKNEW